MLSMAAAGMTLTHKRKQAWQKVVSVLATITVFCTTYALIIPAITWDRTLICEREEHIHTDACWSYVEYPETQKAVCGIEEHTHSEGCYIEHTELICGLREGHVHSDACAGACGLEEGEIHVHDDSCFDEEGSLICGKMEDIGHVHSDECYHTEYELVCEIPEHTHCDECLVAVPAHTERELTCGKEEHVHDDSCFDAPPSEPDSGFYCGYVEHVHNELCYFADGTLRCTVPEHVHEIACTADKLADLVPPYEYENQIAKLSLGKNWRKNVLSIAESQIGYKESERNFEFDGDAKKGYTKYGDWYGIKYGDWCATFVSFCVHYAGVEDYPIDCACQPWIRALGVNPADLDKPVYYHKASAYSPVPGDIIFYDWDAVDEYGNAIEDYEEISRGILNADGNPITDADHMGIVYEVIEATDSSPARVRCIEGNVEDCVGITERKLSDPVIKGYAVIPENPHEFDVDPEEELTENTVIDNILNFFGDVKEVDDTSATLKTEIDGEKVTLTVCIEGINLEDYLWQWQISADLETWSDIEGAANISYTYMTTAAGSSYYRAVGILKNNIDESIITDEPSEIEPPQVTTGPIQTNAPEATFEPQSTTEPENTTEPQNTAEPENTAEPYETATPEALSAKLNDPEFVRTLLTAPVHAADIPADGGEEPNAEPDPDDNDDGEDKKPKIIISDIFSGFSKLFAAGPADRTGDLWMQVTDVSQITQGTYLILANATVSDTEISGLAFTKSSDDNSNSSVVTSVTLTKAANQKYYALTETLTDRARWIGGDGTSFQNKGRTNRYIDPNNDADNRGIYAQNNITIKFREENNSNQFSLERTGPDNAGAFLGYSSANGFHGKAGGSDVTGFTLLKLYDGNRPDAVWLDGTDGDCGPYSGSLNINVFDGQYRVDDTHYRVTYNNQTLCEAYRGDDGWVLDLPETWPEPSLYRSKLAGWYDIYNADENGKKYYNPGDTLYLTGNTVLYAEWLADTYDIGSSDRSIDTLDTSSYIRTYVFDYTDIYNMQGVFPSPSNSQLSSGSHEEVWRHTEHANGTSTNGNNPPIPFYFRDWQSRQSITWPNECDTTGNDRSYQSPDEGGNPRPNNYPVDDHRVTGLFNTAVKSGLFDTSSANPALGVHYIGDAANGNMFRYLDKDTAEASGNPELKDLVGYTYYDSTLNAASYNQSDRRIYVYDYIEVASISLGTDAHGQRQLCGNSDFLLFNSPYSNVPSDKTVGTTSAAGNKGDTYLYASTWDYNSRPTNSVHANFLYGFKTEIDFFTPDAITKDTKAEDHLNQVFSGGPMEFLFTGDDDVWVTVDGAQLIDNNGNPIGDSNLLFDLGGLHQVMGGSINFSTGTVTYYTVTVDGNGNTVKNHETQTYRFTLPEGEHTITIYYMERGSSMSNCKIYFNLTPRYFLDITKSDLYTGDPLKGVEFEIFTKDENGDMVPAHLWKDEAEYRRIYNQKLVECGGVPARAYEATLEESENTFEVKEGGTSCWGFLAGKTYYLKEKGTAQNTIVGRQDWTYLSPEDYIQLTFNENEDGTYSAKIIQGGNADIQDIFTDRFEVDEKNWNVQFDVQNRVDGDTTDISIKKVWNIGGIDLSSAEAIARGLKVEVMVLCDNGKQIGNSVILPDESNDPRDPWRYTWKYLLRYDPVDGHEYNYYVREVVPEGFTSSNKKEWQTYSETWRGSSELTDEYPEGIYIIENISGNGKFMGADWDLDEEEYLYCISDDITWDTDLAHAEDYYNEYFAHWNAYPSDGDYGYTLSTDEGSYLSLEGNEFKAILYADTPAAFISDGGRLAAVNEYTGAILGYVKVIDDANDAAAYGASIGDTILVTNRSEASKLGLRYFVEETGMVNEIWTGASALTANEEYIIANKSGNGKYLNSAGGGLIWNTDRIVAEEESNLSAHWWTTDSGAGFTLENDDGYIAQSGSGLTLTNNYSSAAVFYFVTDDHLAVLDGNGDVTGYVRVKADNTAEIVSNPASASQFSLLKMTYDVRESYTGYTYTNKESDELMNIRVDKAWNDGSRDHAGDAVTMHLYWGASDDPEDHVDTYRTMVLNQANGWQDFFNGLPLKNEKGEDIYYSLREETKDGYELTVTPEVIKAATGTSGGSSWSTLSASDISALYSRNDYTTESHTPVGVYVSTDDIRLVTGNQALTISNGTLTLAAKSDSDTNQRWAVQRAVQNEGSYIRQGVYLLKNVGTGQYLYNTYNGVSLQPDIGTNADNNQYHVRLVSENSSVYVRFDPNHGDNNGLALSDGAVTIRRRSDANPIYFTAESASGSGGPSFEIFSAKNTVVPMINIPVTKEWVGEASNTPAVTVNLIADGVPTGKSITLSSNNNWSGTFENVKKYRSVILDENGNIIQSALKPANEIVYSLSERPVTDHRPVFSAPVSGTDANGNETKSFTVTNVDNRIRVVKVWDNGMTGNFPDITVRLYASDNGPNSLTGITATEIDSAVIRYSSEDHEQAGYLNLTPQANKHYYLAEDALSGLNAEYAVTEPGTSEPVKKNTKNLTLTKNGETFTVKAIPVEIDSDPLKTYGIVTVTNSAGTVLPESGGIGTEAFTSAGMLLTATAALCLWEKERRKRKQS